MLQLTAPQILALCLDPTHPMRNQFAEHGRPLVRRHMQVRIHFPDRWDRVHSHLAEMHALDSVVNYTIARFDVLAKRLQRRFWTDGALLPPVGAPDDCAPWAWKEQCYMAEGFSYQDYRARRRRQRMEYRPELDEIPDRPEAALQHPSPLHSPEVGIRLEPMIVALDRMYAKPDVEYFTERIGAFALRELARRLRACADQFPRLLRIELDASFATACDRFEHAVVTELGTRAPAASPRTLRAVTRVNWRGVPAPTVAKDFAMKVGSLRTYCSRYGTPNPPISLFEIARTTF